MPASGDEYRHLTECAGFSVTPGLCVPSPGSAVAVVLFEVCSMPEYTVALMKLSLTGPACSAWAGRDSARSTLKVVRVAFMEAQRGPPRRWTWAGLIECRRPPFMNERRSRPGLRAALLPLCARSLLRHHGAAQGVA